MKIDNATLATLLHPLRTDLPRPPVRKLETLALPMSQVAPSVRDLLIHLDARSQGDLLEVGICHAGTAVSRISNLSKERTFVAVDPFGDMPYRVRGSEFYTRMYNDELGRTSLRNLFLAGDVTNVNVQHWKMTSLTFFDRILPMGYIQAGSLHPYAFGNAFLDGSHESDVVALEIEFVLPALLPGGSIVIDNMDYEQSDGTCLAHGVAEAAEKLGLAYRFYDSTWHGSGDPVAVLTYDETLLDTIQG